MGLTTNVRAGLRDLQKKHGKEFGKIIQKVLALSLKRLGYRLAEERTVQGVDIDIIHEETGERRAIEVKTCIYSDVTIGFKDVEGLKRRSLDGYESFYAVLSLPLAVTIGWVMVPAQDIAPGKYNVVTLAYRKQEDFSELVNECFTPTFEDLIDELLRCKPGSVLKFLKDNHGI